MKFALVNGERLEAQPNAVGKCQTCGNPMIAKCGEIKMWHWAHQGRRRCDPWWENETEWHRAWKEQFPVGWQEIVHHAESGERHVADVKTDHGWVLEFQHSRIKPEERRSREVFYSKLIWVVDGLRRKRDKFQLANAWNEDVPVGANSSIRKVFSGTCRILQEWANRRVPVFLDFGESQALWWLFAGDPNESTYVACFSRANFIEIHRGGNDQTTADFDELVRNLNHLVARYESHRRSQTLIRNRPNPGQGFQRHLARRNRYRRRL